MSLAEHIYRIAAFAPEERNIPLSRMDEKGIQEVEAALKSAAISDVSRWQIVYVDNLNSDFDDLTSDEISDLIGTNNEIVEADDIKLVLEHAQKSMVAAAEEHREQFFDEEAPIEYVTEPDEAGFMKITAKIDGERFAESTIYPVNVIKLPVT